VSALRVEEELKERQREKAANLRRFQGEVKQRVTQQVRMRRKQQLQESYEAAERESCVALQYSDSALRLTPRKNTCLFRSHPAPAIRRPASPAVPAQQRGSPNEPFQQQAAKLSKTLKQVRRRLASRKTVAQGAGPSELPGGVWRREKPASCRTAAVPAEDEREEPLLAGHHDLPAELQDQGMARQNDDFYIKIEFGKLCDGSVKDSSLAEPPQEPHTASRAPLGLWAGVDREETKKQRQNEYLRYRRLVMNVEREQVKEQRRQKERQRRIAEFVEALRAQTREKMELSNIALPRLCSCGSDFWDSHPDTCANNCLFYKNHKAYGQALRCVLSARAREASVTRTAASSPLPTAYLCYGDNYKELFGALDNAFLVAYAIGMFISGIFGERLPLRYYLSGGMVLSGLFTALFGLGYFWNIHVLWYFIIVQVCNGLVQTTGWPSVVACIGNWFGKGKRGLIMGIWNSHTSVGNILGSLIAGVWVSSAWGLSFVVPGVIIAAVGIICFFFLVEYPEDVGCSPPLHHEDAGGVTSNEKDPEVVTSNEGPLKPEAISFLGALRIPGVVEFSLCLLFAKLVSYTFLYWLPLYIVNVAHFSAKEAGDLSTLFDVGGILGGIFAGLISDYTGGRATTCCVMLVVAAPLLFLYNHIGQNGIGTSIAMLIVCGALVNGPYALITTAVSADLGTHESLKGNAKALSTVTAIIDGTGSIGAALGPLLAGLISPTGWNNVFYMLIAADVLACLLLARVVVKEVRGWCGCIARKRGSTTAPVIDPNTCRMALAVLSRFASLPAGLRNFDMSPREPPGAKRPGGRREAGARQERVGLGRAEARPRKLLPPPRVCFGGRQRRGAVRGPRPTGFLGRFFAVGCFINKNMRNLCCHSVPLPGGGSAGSA
ncbi:PREDICTED: uncharacterized protein LOC104282641, partial [Charadrius vociferus]|uniref:uncharacterized protein LOC104282641 n=1 Tax=Charadrius vociferus TaxID=50402 RepID=UPI0005217C27